MTFDVDSYRIRLRARGPLSFSQSGPADLLRGAFGSALWRGSAYVRLFHPVSVSGPSGFRDSPRPFVFRASHLAGRSLASGELFCFEMNFFERYEGIAQDLARAFALFAKADLESVEASTPISIPLQPRSDRLERLRVEFLTPTELKGANGASRPAAPNEFAALFARARDRVSTLRSCYGAGPLEIDFRATGERARSVRLTRSNLRYVAASRRSRSTGQAHSIGGFTGVAEYEGDLGEFLPILEAARWTGVGRHCVWGNGEIVAVAL